MTAPTKVELSITTTSRRIPRGNLPPGTPPQITMNGNPFPQPAGGVPTSGFQIVVIDAAKDMTNPASILANRYVVLAADQNSGWMSYYPYMYDWMARYILNAGDPDRQRVFVVSFNLDANVPPTPLAYEMLLGLGAGPTLQYWETHVDIGSQGGGWVNQPANYILVGYSAYGYGEGYEKYDNPGTDPVQSNLTVTLSNPPGEEG